MHTQTCHGFIICLVMVFWNMPVDSTKEGCGRPTEVDGAVFVDDRNSKLKTFGHGTVVYYKCSYGRDLTGFYNNRTCQHGKWTEPDFQCKWRACGYIEHPKNGRRLNNNSEPNENTEFTCDKGYTMKGPRIMTCRVGGSWRPANPPTCIRPAQCGHIEHPKNGRRLDNNSEQFQYTEFACDIGYIMKGPQIMICRVGGSWRPADPPTCIITEATCNPFEPFENGNVTYTDDVIKNGTRALFKCDHRADLEPDTEFAVCLPSGEWNDTPRCLEQLLIKPSLYQTIKRYNNRWVRILKEQWIASGGEIRGSCKRNYELFHNGYLDRRYKVSRNNEGVWNPPVPICKEKRCDVPSFPNGNREYENGTTAVGKVEHGVVLKTVCHNRYEVDKHETNTCDRGDIPRPSCIPKRCDVPSFSNGNSEYENRTVAVGKVEHGVVLKTVCNNRYEVDKHETTTCDRGDIPRPSCILKRCDVPSFPNGNSEYENGTNAVGKVEHGVVLKIVCNKRYEVDRHETTTCDRGDIDMPICMPKRCDVPSFSNGNSEYENRTVAVGKVEHGVVLKTVCNNRYEVDKHETTTCDRGDIDMPNCIPKRCDVPSFPNGNSEYQNGTVAVGKVEHGVVLKTVCNNRYEVDRHETTTCDRGDIDMPNCIPKRCDVPSFPNGNSEYQNGTVAVGKVEHGVVLKTVCNNRYEVDRHETTTCDRGDIARPSCMPKRCDVPSFSNGNSEYENGTVAAGKVEHGVVLKTVCNKRYEVDNHETTTCDRGDIDMPICMPKRCDVPSFSNGNSEYENGTVAVGKVEHGVVLKTVCNNRYEVDKHETTTCDRGDIDMPNCIPKRCDVPSFPNGNSEYQNGTVAVGKVEHGVVLKTVCNNRYEVDRHETTTCDRGDIARPSCMPKRCDVPSFSNGNSEYENGTVAAGKVEHGVVLKTVCNKRYEVDNHETTTCDRGDIDMPICMPKRCDVPSFPNGNSEYKNGTMAVGKVEHGVVLKTVCNNRYEVDKHESTTCDRGDIARPSCMPKRCDVPSFSNGNSEYENGTVAVGNVEHGVVLKTVCSNRYEVDRHETTTCDRGDIARPSCIPKSCHIPKIPHAHILKKLTHEVLDTSDYVQSSEEIELICEHGFEFENGETELLTKCTLGRWDKTIPQTCSTSSEKCRIGYLTDGNTMIIRSQEGVILSDMEFVSNGEIVQLHCPSGYQPTNNVQVSTCIDGEWSDLLICETATCTVPAVQNALLYNDDGMVLLSAGDKLYNEQEVFIACKNDNVIDEKPFEATYKRIMCSNGTLAELPPKACVNPRNCDMQAPEHSKLIVGKTFLEGGSRVSQIELKCNRGHKIYSRAKRLSHFKTRCVDGKLQNDLPVCERRRRGRTNIPCKLPNSDIYSIGYARQDIRFKSYITHTKTCRSRNYYGLLRTKCLDGTWDPKIPSCDVPKNKDCQLPSDGRYTFDDEKLSPGDTVTNGQLVRVACSTETFEYLYYYDDGLNLSQNKSILCHSGSLFGLDTMECEESLSEDCKTSVQHGVVKDSFRRIIVSCDGGYTLTVSSVNSGYQCRNGVVVTRDDKQVPKCIPNDCELPDELGLQVKIWPEENIPTYLSGSVVVKHTDRILLNCPYAGYDPFNRVIQCLAGKWFEQDNNRNLNVNVTFPICKPAVCSPQCENFGQCIRNNTCQCKSENKGDRCEKFKCSEQCIENGGSCPTSIQCECPKNKHGEYCELNGCELPDDSRLQVQTWPRGHRLSYLSSSKVVKHLERVLVNCIESGYEPSNRTIQCKDGKWSEVENDWDLDVNKTFPTCRLAVCQPQCEHSGQCIRNNKCQCKSENEGDRCEKSKRCTEGDFLCGNRSNCYAREERCDGKYDCPDGSDEIDCGCQASEFKCGSGECIGKVHTCDLFPDCMDESDEARSLCTSVEEDWCSQSLITTSQCASGASSYWYYEQLTGMCKEIPNGECNSNRNSFTSRGQCERYCSQDRVCQPLTYTTGVRCLALLSRWTYNNRSGNCESFKYGGCGGSANNFGTKEACERKCDSGSLITQAKEIVPRRLDICNLQPDIGPCKHFIRKWHFNSVSQACEEFTYGGCLGNHNNFVSKLQCMTYCDPSRSAGTRGLLRSTTEAPDIEGSATVVSISEPETAVAGCGPPNTTAEVVNRLPSYNKTDRVELTCRVGYRLKGDSNLTCLETGNWTGSAVCVEYKEKDYRIHVTTGPHTALGTDGQVFVQLYGKSGQQTNEIELTKHVARRWNRFQRLFMDTSVVKLPDVGEISHIDIRLQIGNPNRDNWHLVGVSIFDPEGDKYYGFPGLRRLHENKTKVTLHPNKGLPSRQCGDTFSNGVKMVVPGPVISVRTKTDIECRMLCTESKQCYAVAYISNSRYCRLLKRSHFNKAYKSNLGRCAVFTRINCSTG